MLGVFTDKIVWITGASSGIGEALSYEFSKEGAKLILSAVNEDKLKLVKSKCPESHENIFVLPMDISNTSDIKSKSGLALQKWGKIDYMVHNAGIAARDLVNQTDMMVFRKIMEVNYFGTVALTKVVLPAMLQAKSGHFVVVCSLSAKYGVPKLSAYAGSKHALLGFFESLRTEVRKMGIGVTIIIPGFINTPILLKAIDGQGNVTGRNLSVNEKGMSPEQCAILIVRAVKKRKQEALIGRTEIWSVYIHRFFPLIFNKIIASHPMKKLRHTFPWLFR